MPELEIRAATEDDVPPILWLIRELAEYEHLSHEVVATEEALRDSPFGERPVAEVLIGHLGPRRRTRECVERRVYFLESP